jgi:hypothetical protein
MVCQDCIYLRYSDNIQGGHELLHLPTNQIIVRQYVTHVPISPAITKQVHQISETEEMPNGLKIKNRVNNILYDHVWIAGVDYENEEDHEMMTITMMMASMMRWILMKLKALHTIQPESVENSMNMMMIKRKNTLEIIQMTMMTMLNHAIKGKQMTMMTMLNHAMKGKQMIILMNMLTFMKMMNQMLK